MLDPSFDFTSLNDVDTDTDEDSQDIDSKIPDRNRIVSETAHLQVHTLDLVYILFSLYSIIRPGLNEFFVSLDLCLSKSVKNTNIFFAHLFEYHGFRIQRSVDVRNVSQPLHQTLSYSRKSQTVSNKSVSTARSPNHGNW